MHYVCCSPPLPPIPIRKRPFDSDVIAIAAALPALSAQWVCCAARVTAKSSVKRRAHQAFASAATSHPCAITAAVTAAAASCILGAEFERSSSRSIGWRRRQLLFYSCFFFSGVVSQVARAVRTQSVLSFGCFVLTFVKGLRACLDKSSSFIVLYIPKLLHQRNGSPNSFVLPGRGGW
jgi:hypothetical protein